MYIAIYLFLMSWVSTAVSADEIDDYVIMQLGIRHIPAAAIAVLKDGTVVKQAAYGIASVEFQVPASNDTVFEIGSVTKQFTAALVMMLVQEGKIDIDHKISNYLPNTPEAWKNVSVRHLLNHTSGIPSYTRVGGFELSKHYSAAEAIKELSKFPMDFEPGERYLYNNSGYSLLGYIIQNVSGKPYFDVLTERIFSPLGMSSSNNRDPKKVLSKRANGYEWQDGLLTGRDGNLTDLLSAGAIVSSIKDMAKWEAALTSNRFLNEASKAQMWRRQKLNSGEELNYGFGWVISNFRGQRLVSHGGQTAGFAANFSRFFDKGISVIVLTNIGTQGEGTVLARGISKFYIPKLRISEMKVVNDSNLECSKRFREALENAVTGSDLSSYALPAVKKSLSEWRAKDTLELIRKSGKIAKFELVESPSANRGIYRIVTPRRIFLVAFSENAEGKLAELEIIEDE